MPCYVTQYVYLLEKKKLSKNIFLSLFRSFTRFGYNFTILLPLLNIPSPILLLHHQSLLIVLVSSFVVGELFAFSSSAELP